MAELKWNSAIQKIKEYRDPVMQHVYQETEAVQERAAQIFYRHQKQYEKHGRVPKQVEKLITNFAYDLAVRWHEDWKDIGDELLTEHWAIQATSARNLPQWWTDLIQYEPPVQ